jgi:hypothetical protein
MKNFILLSIFTLSFNLGKAQCIRIYVAEKIKEAEIPVERRKFEVTINDTMKLNLTSGNNGLLGRIPLDKGTYKVVLKNPEYADAIVNDVIVEESRSNNLTVNVVPAGPVKVEEKKVDEKPKSGKK